MEHVYVYATTVEDFYRLRSGARGSVVVFAASWCPPCGRLKKWLDEKCRDLKIPIVVVDVEEPGVASLASTVHGMPTIELYRGEKLERVMEGFREKELVAWLAEFY
jgi:thiol-disulfide isomerase/thioredoxin